MEQARTWNMERGPEIYPTLNDALSSKVKQTLVMIFSNLYKLDF